MKRVIVFLIAVMMAFLIAGCSGNNPGAVSSEQPQQQPEQAQLDKLYIAGELVYDNGQLYEDKLPQGVSFNDNTLTLNNATIDSGLENPAIYAIGSMNIEFFGENVLTGKYALSAQNSDLEIAGEGKLSMYGSDLAAVYLDGGKINFNTGSYYIQGRCSQDQSVISHGIYAKGYVNLEYGVFEIVANTSAVTAEMENESINLVTLGGYATIKTGGATVSSDFQREGKPFRMTCIGDDVLRISEEGIPLNALNSVFIN